ncbi:hypothetical protein H0H93_004726, partial [Arthromyces matolae]
SDNIQGGPAQPRKNVKAHGGRFHTLFLLVDQVAIVTAVKLNFGRPDVTKL